MGPLGSRFVPIAGRTGAALAAAALIMSVGSATAQANKFLPAPGSPYGTGNEPYSVNPGNFSPDLLADLAVVNGTSNTVQVFNQQPGDSGFTLAAGSPFAVGNGPNFAAVADYNGDGRQDLAVSSFSGAGVVSVMLQQADHTFSAEGAGISVGGQLSAIGSGDFDGDGKQDIAVAESGSHHVYIYLRKTDNTGFVAGSNVDTGGTNPRYIAVGDLDGTGGPDVAVTNAGSGTVAVLLDQPGGSFAPATGSPFGVGTAPQFVAIAPLNGDNRPDIAVANRNSDNVTVLDQKPGGDFQEATGSPFTVGHLPIGIAAADFRGSGHTDLAVADSGSGAVTILQNDGTTFTRTDDIPVAPGVSPYGIATGRFNDGDILPDIAVTSIRSAPADPNYLSVFINQPPPDGATVDATGVGTSTARLNATVNPRGSSTTAHFEYGTTTAYGSVTGDIPVGSDRSGHSIGSDVEGLAAGTTYHIRIVTSNVAGSSNGDDLTFTTGSPPPPPPPPPSTLSGPPHAFLSAPTEVTAGTPTTLSAEGSTPASGLTYRFDLDGSGAFATDLKAARSLETTFTTPGDVNVGLRVTDALGRTDTMPRTVHVTAPPLFGLSYSPRNPKPGDKVQFNIRQLIDNQSKFGAPRVTPLASGTLSTMTFGDGRRLTGTAGALQIQNRDASTTGTFTHVFDRAGSFRLHVGVDDLNGFAQGVDVLLPVGRKTGYQPAITTPTTAVEQGSCVPFTNATADQLSVDHAGPVQNEDINPAHKLLIAAPPKTFIPFGGEPKFSDQAVNIDTLVSGSILAGSPFAHIQYAAPALLNFRRVRFREAEPTQTTGGAEACRQEAKIESAVADAQKPYPANALAGMPQIPECPGGQKLTSYSTDRQVIDPTLAHVQTTRHTWFSINRWDFGDGTNSDASANLPSYQVFHPFDGAGDFTVKLSTTFPSDLGGQLDAWTAACNSNPLNATKNDSRFDTRTAELKLHVRAHYDRIKSRGLWMTSGARSFDETDFPGVYSSSGPVYINTRRNGYGYAGGPRFDGSLPPYDGASDVNFADGVLVVTPDGGPLMVAADKGEIIGAAHVAWQSGSQQVALGPMPLKIDGTPGLVIPEAGPGGIHDFGVVTDPPAVLGSGSPPPRGAAFHVNSAHVVLREGNGGTLDLDVQLPQPLGPDGGASSETVTRDVRGNGRIVANSNVRRGLLDNVDVDIPAIVLVPGIISFDGGKLSHHVGQNPPWQATGGLTILGKKLSMSPDSRKPGCPVSGGLGFYEDGGLANAGAVLDGLQIPIPSPPTPPFAALANPAFEILPKTSSRPLDLFGCLSLHDYPAGDTFTVTGCAGFLSGGSGVSVPDTEPIPFCPDQNGGERFALTDQNSERDPARPGRRILRGVVVRVSGTVGLGPKQFEVAHAYIEYRDSPFTVEAKGHVGVDFAGGHVKIGADVFGRFRSKSDWEIGGEGGITQDVLCFPVVGCPGASVAALIAARGLGACATIYGIGIGGDVNFADRSLNFHFPGCSLEDLKTDLGVPGRRLPRYDELLLRRTPDPLLMAGQAQAGTIQLAGGAPYSLIVVNGTDHSPVVQVRDPKGKLVLDDSGAPVQGLKKPPGAPRPVDLASQTPPVAQATPVTAPQGILHNDLSQYHAGHVDLRHSTLLLIRAPQKGRYTISAKPGSAPITSVSHSNALPIPRVQGGVVTAGSKRMLSLQSKLPTGSTMTISEEGRNLSNRIGAVVTARASSVGATIARVNRHIPFHPALGPAGKRNLVAIVSRGGIPQERIVLGSYRAPAPPKAGRVSKLSAKLRGSRLTVTWRRATNAQRYVVVVKFRHGLTATRTVGPKAHGVVLRDALARLGATVTVHAIGPLSVAGPQAQARVPAVKIKRLKHFVL